MNFPFKLPGRKFIFTTIIRFLTILFIVVAMVLGGYQIVSVNLNGEIKFSEKLQPRGEVDLNGDWEMIFDFKDCDREKFNGLKNKFILSLTHEGKSIKGEGYLDSQIKSGVNESFTNKSKVQITGKINWRKITFYFTEIKRNNHINGEIIIPKKNFNELYLIGYYYGSANNCDGPVELNRVVSHISNN